ncbi:MAG: hypothetical protein J0G99_01825 [Alphaproteobacteria bacterium]|nr:hypothetical protein [Alphaproteobacteria bacterium]
MKTPARRALQHALAITAGVLCFALVFMYTGEADLLYALGSGLGATIFIYASSHLIGSSRH